MNNLEKNIGYVFKNKNLLKQALTHSSATADIHRNYERLEFLGDRILGLTVADMLCHTFADEPDETAVADVLSMLKNARYGG